MDSSPCQAIWMPLYCSPNRRKTDDWNIAQVRYCCLRHGCRAEPWVIVSILLLFLSSFARLKNDERKESNGGPAVQPPPAEQPA
jgi:hypothetical protein